MERRGDTSLINFVFPLDAWLVQFLLAALRPLENSKTPSNKTTAFTYDRCRQGALEQRVICVSKRVSLGKEKTLKRR